MAKPRVFVSSTCYDLGQVRDELRDFIENFGFDPVLSEYGDVYYNYKLHTHESCVSEVDNCQLFILLIGGRFGGKYVKNPIKSITNAEYDRARDLKIPIFSFVKESVLSDHFVYVSNRNNKNLQTIHFPSIENQSYAFNIFEFIDDVRRHNVDNNLIPFKFLREISSHLRKQWAGLFFDLLKQYEENEKSIYYNNTLDHIRTINLKVEKLAEKLLLNQENSNGTQIIEQLDRIKNASEFIYSVLNLFDMKQFSQTSTELSKINPKKVKWYEYLDKTDDFQLIFAEKGSTLGSLYPITVSLESKISLRSWGVKFMNKFVLTQTAELKKQFEIFRSLSEKERKQVFSQYS